MAKSKHISAYFKKRKKIHNKIRDVTMATVSRYLLPISEKDRRKCQIHTEIKSRINKMPFVTFSSKKDYRRVCRLSDQKHKPRVTRRDEIENMRV